MLEVQRHHHFARRDTHANAIAGIFISVSQRRETLGFFSNRDRNVSVTVVFREDNVTR